MNERMINESTIIYLRSIERIIREINAADADKIAEKITCIEQAIKMQFTEIHECLATAITELLDAEDEAYAARKEIHSILNDIGRTDKYLVETKHGYYIVECGDDNIKLTKVTHAKEVPP